jgi:hypothetical protein
MSTIISAAIAAGLKVSKIEIATMNPIIFKTQLIPEVCGLVEDGGKFYQLDVEKNTAELFTAETITKDALKAVKDLDEDSEAMCIAENYGLVTAVHLERSSDDADGCTSVFDIRDELELKVSAVTVDIQNEIIFKTTGISNLSGLTKDGSSYYKLDTAKNTATLINPQGVSEQATKDILAGKDTDFTRLADEFNLISKISFVAKKD